MNVYMSGIMAMIAIIALLKYKLLSTKIIRLSGESEELREQVRMLSVDYKTEALVWSAFMTQMKSAVLHAERHDLSLSMIMIDCDHFKQLNDTYGHPLVDQALGWFGKLVTQTLRHDELFGRSGGDEFAILAYGGEKETSGLLHRLNRLFTEERQNANARILSCESCELDAVISRFHFSMAASVICNGRAQQIVFSLGKAQVIKGSESVEPKFGLGITDYLQQQADLALYAVKNRRN